MKPNRLILSQLLGVNRNRVRGTLADPQGQPLLQPGKLYNLGPDHEGGYSPVGVESDTGIDLTGTLIGYDGLGYSSWEASGGGYELFDGSTKRTASTSSSEAGSASLNAHLQGAGAYRKRDQFHLLDQDGNPFEPFAFTPSFSSVSYSSVRAIDAGLTADLSDVAVNGSTWIAVGAESGTGKIYRSTDAGESWSEEHSVASVAINGVAYGGTTWIAVGAGGNIYRSTDDGLSWAATTTPTVAAMNCAFYDESRSAWLAGGKDIFRSTDDGLNWAVVETTNEGLADWDIQRIAHDGSRFVAISDGLTHAGNAYYVSDDGITWTYGIKLGIGRAYGLVYGGGQWVAVGDTGDVGVSGSGLGWSRAVGNLNGGAGLRAVVYSEHDESYFLCGGTGSLYESKDAVSWDKIQVDDQEEASYQGLAVDADGVLIAVGAGGLVVVAGTVIGLTEGHYTVYYVSHVQTRAGKVVVDLGHESFTFAKNTAGTITASVPADATPAQAVGLLDNLFCDFYVKFQELEISTTDDGEEVQGVSDAETAAVYDFSLQPGDADETISELPLGPELGESGAAATMAFGFGQTAIFAERVFGLLSASEGDYDKVDPEDTKFTLSELGNVFAIGYSDTGWANLMRPSNWLTLRASQSKEFRGFAAISGGLLMFFDNETFLLSGDPALGGLEAARYPDVVGCDENVIPAVIGGVPFTIWKGEVYLLESAGARNISRPVYDRADPFVEVLPEPQTKSVVCRTESDALYRFYLDQDFWMDDVPVTATGLLPGADGDLVLYLDALGNVSQVAEGTPATPLIDYYAIDYGDKARRDMTLRLRLFVEDYSIDPLDRPRLYYKMSASHSAVTDPASTDYVEGYQHEDEIRFTLPHGFKRKALDLRLELRAMPYAGSIVPGTVIDYVEGYTPR